jgi:TolB-like protein/tetratricopeptide (TPR) repeat protein
VYRFDDFLADPETWRLSRDGQEIHLEPVVLKLLIYLIAHRERLVTRDELMDTVWGDTVISESALTKAVARLRKALDDDSDAPRYLETVRSKGYRFVADVSQAGVIRSLAVLPLSNLTGDPEQDYYVDGIQDLLITELSQHPGLRITSRQSTKRYRDSQLPTADIAGELGVDALVEGSLLREGSKIEVTVQLIDGRSDAHLWAERYTRETPYVFSLIADMANAIGAEIGTARAAPGIGGLGHEPTGPVDPRAMDAYAMGIAHFDRFTGEGIRTGIEQFETAVALEPGFALAWGQLGVAHAMQGMFGFTPPRESKENFLAASLQAIEADDQVAIGHSGFGHSRWYMGDFDIACESFEEALRLNPSEPYAIHGDADCLMFEGRMDESVARVRELLTISPFIAVHSIPLPSHLYMARRLDEAIIALTAIQVRIPRYSIHWLLARFYWEQGRFDEALDEERLEYERRGDTILLAALEEGLDAGGPTGALRAVAEALVARASESYVDPFDIAETFARAGAVDEALHWLDKAVEYGSYRATYIAFWPHLDPVRDDPRYEDLLGRVYGARARQIRQAAMKLLEGSLSQE